jgi:hypothetical protein
MERRQKLLLVGWTVVLLVLLPGLSYLFASIFRP